MKHSLLILSVITLFWTGAAQAHYIPCETPNPPPYGNIGDVQAPLIPTPDGEVQQGEVLFFELDCEEDHIESPEPTATPDETDGENLDDTDPELTGDNDAGFDPGAYGLSLGGSGHLSCSLQSLGQSSIWSWLTGLLFFALPALFYRRSH